MKRIVFVLFAFLLLCPFVYAQDSGVRFSDIHGEVSVRPDDEDDDAYEFAEMDTVLQINDRVKTGTRSGCILSFADMSTFVMKAESQIVLDLGATSQSKVTLLAGNIWVNVKKMVSDGTMDIEMSQAVAGIKGTNITCSTNEDGTEDRVKVLRGMARVMIKESGEEFDVSEGEEIVIKKGAQPEKVPFDIQAEEESWSEDVSRLGESIDMGEIPEVLRKIVEHESAEFARLSEAFQQLMALEKVELADALELQKDAERFIGVILEDALILAAARRKVDNAIQAEGISSEDSAQLGSLLREIAAAMSKQIDFQTETSRIMRFKFKMSAVSEELAPEIEMLATELAQTIGEIDAIRAIVSGNPSGLSQDWFKEGLETCIQAMSQLEEMMSRAAALLDQNPENPAAQALVKSISDQMTAVATLMRSLTVVEVEAAKIIEMQQIDDILSQQIVVLQSEISSYDSISGSTTEVKERRLRSSLQIMSSFSRVRRLYVNAQRLNDATMRATAGSAFRTSEQEEVEMLWQNISDRFQQLGIVAQELESNIKDLESQLSSFLK